MLIIQHQRRQKKKKTEKLGFPKTIDCGPREVGKTTHQVHKNNTLEEHERIYTDEQPFNCKYCDK